MYFAATIVAFAMAWAIGAQDVSNALGTSVGAKAVTVQQAIYIAGVCEFLGSLAGGEVAGMISGGILSVDRFIELGDEGVALYAVVMMSTMSGAFIWLAVATYFSLPVSTTHSLVGALVGVGTVTMGPQAINYTAITAIVTSWVTSPLLGGAISFIVFSVIHTQILLRPNPQKAVQQVLPHFYGFTGGTSAAFIARVGPRVLRLSVGKSLLAFAVSYVVSYLVAMYTVVSGLKKGTASGGVEMTGGGKSRTKNKKNNKNNASRLAADSTSVVSINNNSGKSKLGVTAAAATAAAAAAAVVVSSVDHDLENSRAIDKEYSKASENKPNDVEASFGPLMVVTACVVSIAHGSNDVSNAVGPFTAIAHIHSTGQIPKGGAAPVWVLMCGGVGIVAGLGTYGHKVMATIGEKIAKLTFTRGFSAQIGTALTVLCATQVCLFVCCSLFVVRCWLFLCLFFLPLTLTLMDMLLTYINIIILLSFFIMSQLGLSVSTTHCLIGAITGVALVEGTGGINRETIRKIVMSWVITCPASAILAIACYTPVSVMFGGESYQNLHVNQNTRILGENMTVLVQ
jgi:phosphate/sulfate permease